jgi:hypothetical protein
MSGPSYLQKPQNLLPAVFMPQLYSTELPFYHISPCTVNADIKKSKKLPTDGCLSVMCFRCLTLYPESTKADFRSKKKYNQAACICQGFFRFSYS